MSQIVLNIRPTSEPRSMNAQTALGLTNGPQWQLDIEPIGKNAQIALALTNGKVACVCAHQWTYPVLELVRSASFHSTETKLKWAASAKQGRNREDPQNKSCLTAARNAPPWRRQWHPTPVLLPGKSHGRQSLVGCSPPTLSGAWLSHKHLLTEAQNLLKALVPIPQPPGQQVPNDHLHLVVQLHLTGMPFSTHSKVSILICAPAEDKIPSLKYIK